jgi:hypothetical protein
MESRYDLVRLRSEPLWIKSVRVPFLGQKTQLSREQAIERYLVLRLRVEDINRLDFLVKGFYAGSIQLPNGAPFTHADLKETARTAFFGWFATLTDKDGRAVYAFDPMLVLFPDKRARIIKVQSECETCHEVLQRFRNTVAFHSRSDLDAHIKARRALTEQDTFLDLESARKDFQRLMAELITEELWHIPELPNVLTRYDLSHHPAFANVFSST